MIYNEFFIIQYHDFTYIRISPIPTCCCFTAFDYFVNIFRYSHKSFYCTSFWWQCIKFFLV